MRTSRRNRILSALLVLVMLFTLLPVSAFAADVETVKATKVTAAQDNWEGEYLLVYENGLLGFNGGLDNPDAAMSCVGVSQKGNEVTAPAGISVTIEAIEGGYAMKTASGKYIYASSDSNMLSSTANLSTASKYPITISVDADGNADIVCGKTHLRFNATADQMRFRFYKSTSYTNQSAIALYAVDGKDPYSAIDKQYSVYEKVDKPAAGDTVIVYNALNSKALSSTPYYTYYLTGVDQSIDESGYMAVLPANAAELQWVVGENEGVYTFTQGDMMLSGYISGTHKNISTDASKETGWKLESCNADNNSYYMYNATMESSYEHVYIEWYAAKTEFTVYDTGAAKLSENAFGMTFYKLVREGEVVEDDSLLADGAQVVIYNQNAEGVLSEQNDTDSINNVACTIEAGKAIPANGAAVFTIEKNGDYFRFKNDTYGYLCSNGTGNNGFYSKNATDDADWKVTEAQGGVGGYNMESRTAKFNGKYSQFLEYYADSYKTYSMNNVTDYTIYSFSFLPIADGIKLYNGIANTPAVVFESKADAMVGQDYQCKFSLSDVADISDIAITAVAGEKTVGIDNYTVDGKTYSISIDKSVFADANTLDINVSVKNAAGDDYNGKLTVNVLDEPVIAGVTPSNGGETGSDKMPAISAEVVNAGENPTVLLKLNDTAVEATYADGVVKYVPSTAMEDGRVNVSLTVTRTDGKSVTKTWFFIVGEAQYQLYFGQLHSHTTESDGSGTLDAALDYFKGLPESANVDFVAFTDHSNYFDSNSNANPEQAIYDTSLASAECQKKWGAYRSKVADFNEANAGSLVAIAGFEMTWSGGPGHINTFNTPGVVSRNNSTLNNKTADAGMKAYYALLSQSEGADSISQFNHPGSTFGTFTDFSYWDAVIDSRIFLVEVGNGEGQIGAGGYYPSYEYYTMALDKGWHVAPTNNQDNHKGKWGNANDARDVILTDDFSESGIYNAMRDMRIYSTEDKNLELHYTVNGLQLGSQITDIPEKLDISVQVNDPDASDSISKVEVIVNSGKTVYTWNDPSALAKGDLSVSLDPDYSYYYIRVTEGDGDLAVTAPVWIGESLKLGIASVECGTSTPVTGEELEISTTIFNSESVPAEVKSLTFTTNGSEVIGAITDNIAIGASENRIVSFKFTPEKAKIMKITVTAVIEQEGKEYTFTKDIELDIFNSDDLVYIGIDASHYNEYVAGNYKDSMGNFGNLAAGYSVRTVDMKTSEDLIAACNNEKYKAIILTAPSRRLAAAQSDPRTYSADEIAALAAFNNAGGTVILAGWSDNYENYSVITGNSAIKHMSTTQNEVLAALGSSLRINDDATVDDSLNGGQAQRLYFSTYNMDSFLLNGVDFDAEHPNDVLYTERYSQYGGCSIYAVDADGNATAALPATVTPIVYGHASTYTKDSDKDGMVSMKYSYADGDDRVLVLASEQQEGKGMVIVAGAAFMSNFEVQATVSDNGAEKNYSNYKLCENLVQYINPVSVTDIADVQKQTEIGIKYTIEGVVTSNASGYDKDTAFFDCIYVQDDTAGICCFPVAGSFKIGDKVRITGTTDFYQGEMELQVISIQKIGDGEVAATSATAKQVNDGTVLGSLVTVKGVVTRFELENGLVQTIMVKDAEGNTVRVFIDGYITTAEDVRNLAVGCEITVTGLASYDDTFNAPEGPFPRIRVRDRADVVCGEVAQIDNPFVDVTKDDYFFDSVMWAVNKNPAITNGTDATHFSPAKNCTRAQAVTFLWREAGCPKPDTDSCDFTDVVQGEYYYEAVLWAVERGITNGTSATKFSPNKEVTRAQVVTFLYRMAGKPEVTGNCPYVDVTTNDYFRDAVIWAGNKEITNGMNENHFAPSVICTRAHIVTFIYRYDSII